MTHNGQCILFNKLDNRQVFTAGSTPQCMSLHDTGLNIIWDSVQLNHPFGTFSKFPEQAKEK